MESYIRACNELAKESARNGEAPFGSLILKNNQVIAKGGNAVKQKNDVSAHAEIVVMRLAQEKLGDDLSECEIYSNCEPCPMCAFLIRELGLRKVFFGVRSPNMGGSNRWNILGDVNLEKFLGHKPPEVIGGILTKECLTTFQSVGWGNFLNQ